MSACKAIGLRPRRTGTHELVDALKRYAEADRCAHGHREGCTDKSLFDKCRFCHARSALRAVGAWT